MVHYVLVFSVLGKITTINISKINSIWIHFNFLTAII